MLRTSGHLAGFKCNIDQILADGAGQRAAQQGKILIRFIFRHHAGRLTEFGNDLFIFIDIAAADSGNIAALSAKMPANLSDFLIIHLE